MKMSDWKRMVKELTREISSLNKELSKIRKMNKTEKDKLGLSETGDVFTDLKEYEEVTSSFPMYGQALESRRKKEDEIRLKRDYLNKVLLGIKCIALYKAKKLSKESERNGFLDNRAYAEALINAKGFDSQAVIDALNKYLYEENWAFDFFDMNPRDAEKIGRMM